MKYESNYQSQTQGHEAPMSEYFNIIITNRNILKTLIVNDNSTMMRHNKSVKNSLLGFWVQSKGKSTKMEYN